MAPSVDETLEDVNQRLDRLLLRVMDDLEDLKEKRQCLNGVIEEGWLCLSQSRYSMGNKSVSSLQYTPEMTPSSFVQDSAADDGVTTFTAERVQPETQDKVTERKLPEVEDIGAADHVYMIKLGTLENEGTAEVEWRWHPYTNTAKKRKYLTQ
ncbi:vacuolar ATPase assembly protein VMA22-like [Anomaloglossus baeobatrachus]|uniref:vacuolar ATPase assembly protein VMA22-like n=1 Tax=Anomaloglossus baeobatrachus TaxID=238106 RepID=UPI003F506067